MAVNFTKAAYIDFLRTGSTEKSNKTGSYWRALNKLGSVLGRNVAAPVADVWTEESPERLFELYRYLLSEQKKSDGGIFKDRPDPSYWQNRFYSSAVLALAKFRAVCERDMTVMRLFSETGIDGRELSRRLNAVEVGHERVFVAEGLEVDSPQGRESVRQARTLLNQGVFRKIILSIYCGKCCVCGLNMPEVLRASHIVACAKDPENQLNPSNGLCLSATYDAAFDRHLISFDEDYRMILAPSLKEYTTNDAFQTSFAAYEGKRMVLPNRFPPSQEFLSKHREQLV